jgi:hypothetical protein
MKEERRGMTYDPGQYDERRRRGPMHEFRNPRNKDPKFSWRLVTIAAILAVVVIWKLFSG